jgi:hypothetical protein
MCLISPTPENICGMSDKAGNGLVNLPIGHPFSISKELHLKLIEYLVLVYRGHLLFWVASLKDLLENSIEYLILPWRFSAKITVDSISYTTLNIKILTLNCL